MIVLVTQLLLILLLEVSADCPPPQPDSKVALLETAPQGTELFKVSFTGVLTKWNVRYSSPLLNEAYLKQFFVFKMYQDRWTLNLEQTFDVEQVYATKKVVISGTTITFDILCISGNSKAVFRRYATIVAMNEFAPEFINKNTTIHTTEEQSEDTIVADLRLYVVDKDIESPSNPDPKTFKLNSLTSILYRKLDMFSVSEEGYVLVNHVADYEAIDRYYSLDVTVSQGADMQNTGIVNIQVDNINDNAPVFIYIGCWYDCTNSYYLAAADGCYIGPLYSYTYGPINSIDPDFEPVRYRIIHASPTQAVNFVQLDEKLGSIQITQFLALMDSSLMGLVIQAYDTGVMNSPDGNWGENTKTTLLLVFVDLQAC